MSVKIANYTGLGLTLTSSDGTTNKSMACGGFRNAISVDVPTTGTTFSVKSTNYSSSGTTPMIASQNFTIPSTLSGKTVLIGVVPSAGSPVALTAFDPSNTNVYFVECYDNGAISGNKPGLTQANIAKDNSYMMVGLVASNVDQSTIYKNQSSIWQNFYDSFTSGSSYWWILIVVILLIFVVVVVIAIIYYFYKKHKKKNAEQ